MKLHVVGGSSNHQVKHTLRNSDGSWQTSFGNILGAVSNPSGIPLDFTIRDTDCVIERKMLHVCFIDQFNRILYVLRNSDGSWSELIDLTPIANGVQGLQPGTTFSRIACTIADSTVSIIILTNQSSVVRIDKVSGSAAFNWQAGPLITFNASHGTVLDITCFTRLRPFVNLFDFYIGTTTSSGRLVRYRYTVHLDHITDAITLVTMNNETWFNHATTSGLNTVSGAFISGDEHYVMTQTNGTLLHFKSGQSFFGNVNGVNGNPNIQYRDVSCTEIDLALHVAAVSTAGVPFHTVRKKGDRGWQGFMGNIAGQSSNPGTLTCIGIG